MQMWLGVLQHGQMLVQHGLTGVGRCDLVLYGVVSCGLLWYSMVRCVMMWCGGMAWSNMCGTVVWHGLKCIHRCVKA